MRHNYKLTEDQVLSIKNDLATTKRAMFKLAEDYGLALATVRMINQGEAHRDVGSFIYPIRAKKYLPIHDLEKRNTPKKLSDDDALEIMMRLEMGESSWDIAKDYDVSYQAINNLTKRPMFRHMDMFDE